MSKGDAPCPATSQNPSLWHPCWLSSAYDTRKDPELERLAKDNQETNPIPIKPETAGHMGEQLSWVPLPSCSPPRHPFPIKSLAVLAHVSPQNIYIWVLDKGPLLGPERGPPSCNIATEQACTHEQQAGENPEGSSWGHQEIALHLSKEIWVARCHGYHIAIQHDSDYIKLKSGIQSYILFVDMEIYRKHCRCCLGVRVKYRGMMYYRDQGKRKMGTSRGLHFMNLCC